jgi:hypothetical protein
VTALIDHVRKSVFTAAGTNDEDVHY